MFTFRCTAVTGIDTGLKFFVAHNFGLKYFFGLHLQRQMYFSFYRMTMT
jgi:hypothetical protein